jgi:hypothetical protein
MSIPRSSHTMTLLPSGKVLAAGGNNSPVDTRPAELYEPDTGRWTTTGAMLEERFYHTATLLPSGMVLVVGGYKNPFGLASAELYDPATGEWHATGSLSTGRFFHTATLLASGKVLVLGGVAVGIPPSAELYDLAAGTWTLATPMLAARYMQTATLLSSGAVLVAGGCCTSSTELTEAELYDPAAGTWHPTGSLSVPHAGHTATRLPSGRVLVVDGRSNNNLARNTELFNPASETWSDSGCTVEPRVGHTATLLLSGAVLVAGGFNLPTGSAELYGIFVSPAQVSLTPGATQTFTARGGSGFDYVWSFLQNKSGGTLTASGLYQAGLVGGVTDVLQVVDSFANSATATVNVTQHATTVSATSPEAKSFGCGTTGGAPLPWLGAVLALLGWRSLTRETHPEDTAQKTWAT